MIHSFMILYIYCTTELFSLLTVLRKNSEVGDVMCSLCVLSEVWWHNWNSGVFCFKYGHDAYELQIKIYNCANYTPWSPGTHSVIFLSAMLSFCISLFWLHILLFWSSNSLCWLKNSLFWDSILLFQLYSIFWVSKTWF